MNTLHPNPSSVRILVVDDEPNIRLLVRATLESEGYVVLEAGDGAEGLRMIADEAIDLVVLDLNMPVVDGMGVLKQLHTHVHPPRVVVLTAYGSIDVAVKATRLGAADFLEKPVTPKDLRETVAAVLHEAEPAVEPSGQAQHDRPDYVGVLNNVRRALRSSDMATAESLLLTAADLGQKDAAYFNLIGVIYELRHQWRLAKKFYGKALQAEKHYASAQQNMRRIYELYTFGSSKEPVALGDEPGDAWFAKATATRP